LFSTTEVVPCYKTLFPGLYSPPCQSVARNAAAQIIL
jgi:hypothetical protein